MNESLMFLLCSFFILFIIGFWISIGQLVSVLRLLFKRLDVKYLLLLAFKLTRLFWQLFLSVLGFLFGDILCFTPFFGLFFFLVVLGCYYFTSFYPKSHVIWTKGWSTFVQMKGHILTPVISKSKSSFYFLFM